MGANHTRREWLLAAAAGLAAPGAVLWPARAAFAGSQIEEPLAASVRSALSAAIAEAPPPQPEFVDTQAKIGYLRWLGTLSERLRSYLPDWQTRIDFLGTAWYEAKRAGLEPALVLGLVQTESAFRRYAVSSAGALGYMQVMPFWSRLIGDGDVAKLFYLQTNLRYGCVILRHYLDREDGDLFLALGRYNGSRGQAAYPDAVFANRRHWLVTGAAVTA